MFTCLTSPVALLDIEVYEATGTVCADTGASQSLGGELMFKFLRNRGQKFSEFHLAMCLADGQQSTSLVQKATVPITVGGRTFQIDLIFLPHAKGNRTLLGVDFLRTSGIARVMDMRNNFWYFGDKPSFRIPFSKDVPLPVDDSPVEINSSSCPTNSIPSEIPLHSNTVDEEICELKTIVIDFPTRTANELRTEQLKDLELKKIIDCFENPNKGVDFANWTGRVRDESGSTVPSCSECITYKATNQKPAGLLQTPVPAERFESIAIDLLVPYQKRPKASQNRSAKLMPRRDGPYIVLSQRSPTTFVVASCNKPDEPLGVYHTSALTPFLNGTETQSPVVPLKKRGRPRKQPLVPRCRRECHNVC
ncbi:transposon Tf2-8 polyprotein [Trichonephila clavipes]|nr:transposon Tf2-8 polyprotein [Trichonephila clavipes]